MKLNRLMDFTTHKECESVATGFQHLDHLTGGLRIGQLCTVAARRASTVTTEQLRTRKCKRKRTANAPFRLAIPSPTETTRISDTHITNVKATP